MRWDRMTPDERRAEARRLTVAERRAQGLPDSIEDQAALDRVAALLRGAREQAGRVA